ncbi:hypothetical protein GOA99_19875 [Sinorhizobium meliloti]|nr:Rha family transcriptional regulator [Sinorhizobium meliloti]MDW9363594.1 Rha family transcriptional regulator [Sinorhizobium meliloti]MDW9386893.1 hypothetical protein [Sinorhizobium meliloti]MDW9408138.1 hypothetical protein [Sinorhizobium meliloti]MDW9453499.1 hypothetical protein [Sinorhizobium meliloti]MDW9466138.1 hypothetical protein [Sinorhizobium meliloti]
MSSLEIAGLTGKRHDHVVRDVRKMFADLGTTFPQNWGKVPSGKGRPIDVVNLPKRETLILVSGYSTEIRARIIDRWMELEAAIASATSTSGLVTDLAAEVRSAIGGITKGIVHKELTEVIPALVRAEIASNTTMLRSGRTSGEIWAQFGLPKLKNAPTWLGNRLAEMGCAIEHSGCIEVGGRKFRLFDPDKAGICMKNGLLHKAKAYAAERVGQGKLRLVSARGA